MQNMIYEITLDPQILSDERKMLKKALTVVVEEPRIVAFHDNRPHDLTVELGVHHLVRLTDKAEGLFEGYVSNKAMIERHYNDYQRSLSDDPLAKAVEAVTYVTVAVELVASLHYVWRAYHAQLSARRKKQKVNPIPNCYRRFMRQAHSLDAMMRDMVGTLNQHCLHKEESLKSDNARVSLALLVADLALSLSERYNPSVLGLITLRGKEGSYLRDWYQARGKLYESQSSIIARKAAADFAASKEAMSRVDDISTPRR